MRLPRVRFTIRWMMVGVAVLAAIFAGAVWTWRWWSAPRERPSYIRPLAIDEDTLELFEMQGVWVNGFEFSLPERHVAVVTLIARARGQVIDQLSQRHTLMGLTGPQRVKLVRINPDKLSEKNAGRARWILKIGGSTVLDAWEDNREPATNYSRQTSSVVTVMGLQAGKTYSVWDAKINGSGAFGTRPNRNRPDFSIELSFKTEPLPPGGQLGFMSMSSEAIPEEEKKQEKEGAGQHDAPGP